MSTSSFPLLYVSDLYIQLPSQQPHLDIQLEFLNLAHLKLNSSFIPLPSHVYPDPDKETTISCSGHKPWSVLIS